MWGNRGVEGGKLNYIDQGVSNSVIDQREELSLLHPLWNGSCISGDSIGQFVMGMELDREGNYRILSPGIQVALGDTLRYFGKEVVSA